MWPYHPVKRPGAFRPPLPMIENGRIVDPEILPEEQRSLTTWYTERAVDFIERHKEKSFFFYLAHAMPHVPLFVSDKFQGKSERGLYGDVIMEIDWSVGEVLRALKQHDLEDDTLVIFTSDNGPWLNYGDHGGSAGELREGKLTIWEGGTRVPCLMRWPGRLPAGTVNASYAMTIDLFPTIARLTGAPLPQLPIDGRDIWPLLTGTPGATNPHEAYGFWAGQGALQAVTTGDGRWKLVLPHTFNSPDPRSSGRDGKPGGLIPIAIEAPQLYDLRADSLERRDVAARHPDVVHRLLAIADGFRAELGDTLSGRKGRANREPGKL
jgi:arylsulfatase